MFRLHDSTTAKLATSTANTPNHTAPTDTNTAIGARHAADSDSLESRSLGDGAAAEEQVPALHQDDHVVQDREQAGQLAVTDVASPATTSVHNRDNDSTTEQQDVVDGAGNNQNSTKPDTGQDSNKAPPNSAHGVLQQAKVPARFVILYAAFIDKL